MEMKAVDLIAICIFRIAYIAGYDYSISEKFLFSQFL